jgi:hypothetical protein
MPSKPQIVAQNFYANLLGEINLRVDAINHCTIGLSGLAPPFAPRACPWHEQGAARSVSAALDPRFRGCQEIRRCPADLSFRRSRESGNPGVSVTYPGPPLLRGRRLERAADLNTLFRGGDEKG